jgi:excisionase family DNA binding protein
MNNTVRNPLTVNPDDLAVLGAIKCMLADNHAEPVQFMRCGAQPIELPAVLSAVLREATDALLRGDAVSVLPTHKELTTQEAAELLNVSRPYLIQLLERGQLPYAMTGSHRRIALADVLAYRRQRDAERRDALRELTSLSQTLGIYAADADEAE